MAEFKRSTNSWRRRVPSYMYNAHTWSPRAFRPHTSRLFCHISAILPSSLSPLLRYVLFHTCEEKKENKLNLFPADTLLSGGGKWKTCPLWRDAGNTAIIKIKNKPSAVIPSAFCFPARERERKQRLFHRTENKEVILRAEGWKFTSLIDMTRMRFWIPKKKRREKVEKKWGKWNKINKEREMRKQLRSYLFVLCMAALLKRIAGDPLPWYHWCWQTEKPWIAVIQQEEGGEGSVLCRTSSRAVRAHQWSKRAGPGTSQNGSLACNIIRNTSGRPSHIPAALSLSLCRCHDQSLMDMRPYCICTNG